MEIDFLNIPFENDAHIIFDNDGVLSEITSNPEESTPNVDLLKAIGLFLKQSKQNRFTTLSGRSTTFLLDQEAFADIFDSYPNQVDFFGYYGNQVFDSKYNHIVPAVLEKYRPHIVGIIREIKIELNAILESLNTLAELNAMMIGQRELYDLVIEDKVYGLCIHQRRLMERMGYLQDGVDQFQVKNRVVKRLLSELVQKVIAKANKVNPDLALKEKPGKLVFEIFPDHEGVSIDKVERFKEIYNEHISNGDCSEIFYFGDDLGDAEIFDFCRKNTENATGPKTYFIFVDSSTSAEIPHPDLVRMAEGADFVISASDTNSAIENLANIMLTKIALSRHLGIVEGL